MTLVSEVMNRSPVAVRPDASMAEVAGLLRRTGAEHVLVVDEQFLVGILCACDVGRARPEDHAASSMRAAGSTVRPDIGVDEAAVTLVDSDAGCLAVAVGGLLLGTVSEADLREVAGADGGGPGDRAR